VYFGTSLSGTLFKMGFRIDPIFSYLTNGATEEGNSGFKLKYNVIT